MRTNDSIPGFKNFKYKGYDISFILDYFGQELNPNIKVVLKKYNKAVALKYPLLDKINLNSYSDLVSNVYGIIDFIEEMSKLEAKNNTAEAIKILSTPTDVKEEKIEQAEAEEKQEEKDDLHSWFDNVDTLRYINK